jgi:hypothetical protein
VRYLEEGLRFRALGKVALEELVEEGCMRGGGRDRMRIHVRECAYISEKCYTMADTIRIGPVAANFMITVILLTSP